MKIRNFVSNWNIWTSMTNDDNYAKMIMWNIDDDHERSIEAWSIWSCQNSKIWRSFKSKKLMLWKAISQCDWSNIEKICSLKKFWFQNSEIEFDSRLLIDSYSFDFRDQSLSCDFVFDFFFCYVMRFCWFDFKLIHIRSIFEINHCHAILFLTFFFVMSCDFVFDFFFVMSCDSVFDLFILFSRFFSLYCDSVFDFFILLSRFFSFYFFHRRFESKWKMF